MRRLGIMLILIMLLGGTIFWVITIPAAVDASTLPAYMPDLENGKTMFHAGDCASCHATPGQEDTTQLGGGLQLKSPYGVLYAPNISPDRNDGIGGWSEAQFLTALWKGTSPDGRHYFPLFPYTSYQRMKLEDVRDLFAFIEMLPAVAGKARDHEIAFPFSIRRLLGIWKHLYLDGKQFVADHAHTAQWNRGAYLVNGPAHCAECHSPRDWLSGIIVRQRFAGGPDPAGEGFVPNITQAGIGDYTVADIEEILTTGARPDKDPVGGPMAAVVRSTTQLSKDDRAAMAGYVKSLPPVVGPKPPENE